MVESSFYRRGWVWIQGRTRMLIRGHEQVDDRLRNAAGKAQI